MNQSSDDRRIRKLFQRLKSADQEQVPAFDEVLQRPKRVPKRRPARRLQMAIACGTAATLSVALLITRSRRDGSPVESEPRVAEESVPAVEGHSDERVVDIDFERLRAAVDEHFAAVKAPEWPSRTDSLLAVNLDVSLLQE